VFGKSQNHSEQVDPGQTRNDITVLRLVYFVVFAVSVISMLVSHKFLPGYPDVATFTKELGFAGIIALIIIFTVERHTRSSHQKAANALIRDINKDLFHAIYNRSHESGVFVMKRAGILPVYQGPLGR
jgi:hypothetical protein